MAQFLSHQARPYSRTYVEDGQDVRRGDAEDDDVPPPPPPEEDDDTPPPPPPQACDEDDVDGALAALHFSKVAHVSRFPSSSHRRHADPTSACVEEPYQRDAVGGAQCHISDAMVQGVLSGESEDDVASCDGSNDDVEDAPRLHVRHSHATDDDSDTDSKYGAGGHLGGYRAGSTSFSGTTPTSPRSSSSPSLLKLACSPKTSSFSLAVFGGGSGGVVGLSDTQHRRALHIVPEYQRWLEPFTANATSSLNLMMTLGSNDGAIGGAVSSSHAAPTSSLFQSSEDDRVQDDHDYEFSRQDTDDLILVSADGDDDAKEAAVNDEGDDVLDGLEIVRTGDDDDDGSGDLIDAEIAKHLVDRPSDDDDDDELVEVELKPAASKFVVKLACSTAHLQDLQPRYERRTTATPIVEEFYRSCDMEHQRMAARQHRDSKHMKFCQDHSARSQLSAEHRSAALKILLHDAHKAHAAALKQGEALALGREYWADVAQRVQTCLETEGFAAALRYISCMCVWNPRDTARTFGDNEAARTRREQNMRRTLMALKMQAATGGNQYFLKSPGVAIAAAETVEEWCNWLDS